MNSKLKKFNIILLAANLLLLVIFAVLMGIIASIRTDHSLSNAKQQWDSGSKYKYAQISLYTHYLNGMDDMGIYSKRSLIDKKLAENSVVKDKDENPDSRLWIDCAMGEFPLSITGAMGKADVTACGTMGDYFIFHPEEIMFGSYYTEDDINYDRIVIDEECSWQIFGAMETVGMPVTIKDKVFYVAAVVRTSDDETDLAAYGLKPRIYMPYQALKNLEPTAVMTSYEICVPEIIKNFGYNLMDDIDTNDESARVIVDQTKRFELLTLYEAFGKIPVNNMLIDPIDLPWYENRTRSGEIVAQILSGPAVFMLIIPAISMVYGIYLLVKFGGAGFKMIMSKIEDNYQKKISEIYYKKQQKKE